MAISKPWKYSEYPPIGQVLNRVLFTHTTENYANIYIGLWFRKMSIIYCEMKKARG